MIKTPRCKGCNSYFGISHSEQKVQRSRLIRAGYSDTQIKDAMPCCKKCVTIWKKMHPLKSKNSELKRCDHVSYH